VSKDGRNLSPQTCQLEQKGVAATVVTGHCPIFKPTTKIKNFLHPCGNCFEK